MNKYLALKGEKKFDISKVTVVGSPTITETGVASGFQNGTSYLRTPIKTTDLLDKSWKIVFCFKPSEVVAPQALILWKLTNPNSNAGAEGWSACGFNANNKNLVFSYKTGDATESSSQLYKNISLSNYMNEFITASYEFDIVTGVYTFKAYSENGTLIATREYTAETPNKQLYYINTESSFQITIGTAYSGTSVVGGLIDLKEFKIYVDGQLVFQPVKATYLLERRKPKVWNKGQFNIVGNPSISEDGVASGFSTNDYVTLGSDIINKLVNATNFNFTFRFKTGNSLGSGGLVLGHNNAISGGTFSLWVSASSVAPIVFLNESGTATLKAIGNLTKTINTNTEYEAYFSKNGNNYGFGIRALNESDFTQSAGITSTETIYANTQTIGRNTILNSIDLKQFKIYTKEGYDSKFNIVGSPTITANGVASGFSGSDYVKTPYFPQPQEELIIKTKAIRSIEPNVSPYPQAMQLWLMSSTAWRLQLDTVALRIYGLNASSQPLIIYPTLQGGELIETEVILRPNEQIINLWIDGVKYNTKTNYELSFSSQFLSIPSNSVYYWTGSIDLNAFKIYVDNNLVFDGEPKNELTFDGGAETYVYDASKFTIVGSPTITDDGVASGFSTSNYVKSSVIDLRDKKWKVEGSFTTSNNLSSEYYVVWCLSNTGYFNTLGCYVNNTALNLTINLGAGGIGPKSLTITPQVNTHYVVSIEFTGSEYIFKINDSEYTYKSTHVLEDNQALTGNEYFTLGCFVHRNNAKLNPFLTGSIDLKQFSITVDDKEVFTGAKENFYMLRR